MAPTWLYSIVHLAGASLIAAIYVAGLVVSLRRWHLGMASRLGGIGFGLLLFGDVIQLVSNFLLPLIGASSGANQTDGLFFRMTVVASFNVLVSGAGLLLLVFALRTALRDYERARNATPVDPAGRTAY